MVWLYMCSGSTILLLSSCSLLCSLQLVPPPYLQSKPSWKGLSSVLLWLSFLPWWCWVLVSVSFGWPPWLELWILLPCPLLTWYMYALLLPHTVWWVDLLVLWQSLAHGPTSSLHQQILVCQRCLWPTCFCFDHLEYYYSGSVCFYMAGHLCHYGCCLSSHLCWSYFSGTRPLVSSFAWTWSCNAWLLFSINISHSFIKSSTIFSFSFLIHVSFCRLSMLMVLLINLTLSFNKEISALLMIWNRFGVLTWLFNLILTGTTFSPRHLKVKCLWFCKSAIFNCILSHWGKTPYFPHHILF